MEMLVVVYADFCMCDKDTGGSVSAVQFVFSWVVRSVVVVRCAALLRFGRVPCKQGFVLSEGGGAEA